MADAVHDAQRLLELQALPLERKIQITQARIIEWYQHYKGNVVVSFSGGKDSTVLLHLVRQIYPDVRAVFSNTGLEYPEIQRFVKSFDNVDIVTPSMRFDQVISHYGYPLISKEVAEAIYYARRLRLQNGNVERESRNDTPQADGTARQPYLETDRRRDNLSGKLHGRDWKSGSYTELRRAEIYGARKANGYQEFKAEIANEGGGQTSRLIQTSSARNRRTVLSGRMPGAGVVAAGHIPIKSDADTNSVDSEQPG